jgi:hypothetical protein
MNSPCEFEIEGDGGSKTSFNIGTLLAKVPVRCYGIFFVEYIFIRGEYHN